MPELDAPWGPSTRYRLRRRIGAGGMGIVYEVDDLERAEQVALKTVPSPDVETIYRTKQEFRTLADLEHPNLVRLYDLVVEDSRCFFTMELVVGRNFLDYTGRAEDVDQLAETIRDATARRYDETRLRDALAQLIRAVDALHEAGKVHRDIKPSNVLVTAAGRVVLLDFGLALETAAPLFHSSSGGVVGTAYYMSPEQARADAEISPATDWYAVGVMLYEVITGRLPHTGSVVDVLLAKQRVPPDPPSRFEPSCPPDLDELCVAMLAIAPEERPSGSELMSRFGQMSDYAAGSRVSRSSSTDSALRFLGRERELAALERAAAAARAGNTVVALVHGASGMGKTTLVRRFVEQSVAATDALVLSGRCYRQESIPYKALDGVLDSISRHLRHLPSGELDGLLPPNVGALARLFPVLRRVKRIAAEHARDHSDDVHPAEIRLRAFRCLRDLLHALARRRGLIVVVDDLQWGDDDSAALLFDLLRPPTAPPLLFLATSRTIAVDGAPVLETLERVAALASAGPRHLVEVGPLAEDAARRIAAHLIGRPDDADAPEVARIATDARGCPLVLDELARLAVRGAGAAPLAAGDAAEGLIAARFHRLPALGRALVGVVAVAEEPVPVAVALRAAGVDEGDRATVDALRAGRWLRAIRIAGADCFDTVHDRLREVVRAGMDASMVLATHGALAAAFESSERPPVDRLARHLAAIGDSERACRYAIRAAQEAAVAFAFDRAARLYALASGLAAPPVRLGILPDMATALANAGRAAEAAALHLEIAAASSGPDELEHRRLAADCLLRSGHIAEALGILEEVAGDLGIRVARRSWTALAALVAHRARITLRGLGYKARHASELPPQTLARLDTLGTIATALGVADPVRGMIVQSSYLVGALDAGEEERVCRALMVESTVMAVTGRDEKATRIARDITRIAQRLGTRTSRLWSELALGMSAHCGYRFEQAAAHFAEVVALQRSEPAATHWELTTARLYLYFAQQFYGGAYRSAALDLDDVIEDARRRNDLHAYAIFNSTPMAYVRLADDRPEEALASLERALAGWPRDEYYLMHMYVHHSTALVLQYMGRYEEAADRARAMRAASARAGLLRVGLIKDDTARLVAATAIAAGRLGEAAPLIRYLRRSRHDAVRGHGSLLAASIAAHRGRSDEAHTHLVDAVGHFERARTLAWLASARRRLGELVAGVEGQRLIAEADRWASHEGVVAPDKIAAMHAPWPR